VTTNLAQLLESSRWQPYKLGTLASLPVAAVMTLLWIHYEIVAMALFCLYPFWGLWVFRKTPIWKMISWALLLGSMVSFAIWYCVIINPHLSLR
jgi:hypothetical protein